MRKHKTLIAIVIVLVLGGLAWALLPAGPDPQVVKVQQLQEKLFNPDAQLSGDDRREAFRELREESEKLSDEQRGELMRNMRDNPPPPFRRMQQAMVDYFDLPEDQRKAALDEQIDEMERMRKEFEKRRAERGGDGGPPGGGPWGGGRNMDDRQRNEMAKRMLDNTTPQQRAMAGEYFQALQDRRRERGLPAWPPVVRLP